MFCTGCLLAMLFVSGIIPPAVFGQEGTGCKSAMNSDRWEYFSG